MLYCPFLSPLRASSLLPGGIRKSPSFLARCRYSSLRRATRSNDLKRWTLQSLNIFSVSLHRNDRITITLYYVTHNMSRGIAQGSGHTWHIVTPSGKFDFPGKMEKKVTAYWTSAVNYRAEYALSGIAIYRSPERLVMAQLICLWGLYEVSLWQVNFFYFQAVGTLTQCWGKNFKDMEDSMNSGARLV